MSVSGDDLRRAMGLFATGVTVVTVLDDEGTPKGFTVNSLTSVSLDPPLVLVCVDLSADVYPCFRRDRAFAVNILSEDQEKISRTFASKIEEKFEEVSCRPGKLGPPLLDGCIGHLECRIIQDYPGGDHTIFVGQVEASESAGDGNPLLFYGGKYAKL
ncbi:MAG: flavin reductase family protein [bacterium]